MKGIQANAAVTVCIPKRVFIVAAVSSVPVAFKYVALVITIGVTFRVRVRALQTMTIFAKLIPIRVLIVAAVTSVPITFLYIVCIMAKAVIHQRFVRAAFIFWIPACAIGASCIPSKIFIIATISSIPVTLWNIIAVLTVAVIHPRRFRACTCSNKLNPIDA